MKKSAELFLKSKLLVPGGVHSPVRSFKGMDQSPLFFERGDGANLFDVEGKNYIDFCMSFGPLILGHRHPRVEEALTKALSRGWSFGACEPYSLELADFIISKIPFIEQIRFVNSGTEAVMTALRLARGYTGKNKIIKFNGCYHGHTDSMLIKAGSGLAGTPEASSKGIPLGVANDTIVLELGDFESVEYCFEKYRDDIAAIIIEPLPANNGLLIQDKNFLNKLRAITKKFHSLLIFDEVISGFRVSFDGMAGETKITPDIVTYGKIIGGGLPVGAIAGSREIMERLAPLGDVYQAGTLSANPLAMVGGLATLKELTPEVYAKIENQSKKVTTLLENWLHHSKNSGGHKITIIRHSSLFWLVEKSENETVSTIKMVPQNLSNSFNPLFKELLERGIYLAPNAYEVGFVSLAHNEEVLHDMERRLNYGVN